MARTTRTTTTSHPEGTHQLKDFFTAQQKLELPWTKNEEEKTVVIARY